MFKKINWIELLVYYIYSLSIIDDIYIISKFYNKLNELRDTFIYRILGYFFLFGILFLSFWIFNVNRPYYLIIFGLTFLLGLKMYNYFKLYAKFIHCIRSFLDNKTDIIKDIYDNNIFNIHNVSINWSEISITDKKTLTIFYIYFYSNKKKTNIINFYESILKEIIIFKNTIHHNTAIAKILDIDIKMLKSRIAYNKKNLLKETKYD